MNLEKVVFGFFTLFAATLNFGFFIGEIDNPAVSRKPSRFSLPADRGGRSSGAHSGE